MKYIDWNNAKNEELKKSRNICFEDVVFLLDHGNLLDVIEHPNKTKYPNQRIYIINSEDYICLVPFVEDDEKIFLKTIIPSRKLTRKYLGDMNDEIK